MLPFDCPSYTSFDYSNSVAQQGHVRSHEEYLTDLKESVPTAIFTLDLSYQERIMKCVESFFNEKYVSNIVCGNALRIINNLPETIIQLIEIENVYTTEYKTIIIDIYENSNLFSIEIGKDKVGYFTDFKNTNILVEGLDLSLEFDQSIHNLNRDLLVFFN